MDIPLQNTFYVLQLVYDRSERNQVDAHAEAWIYDTPAAQEATTAVTAAWTAPKWIAFCERLVQVRLAPTHSSLQVSPSLPRLPCPLDNACL